jgi:zinc transport system permease protein
MLSFFSDLLQFQFLQHAVLTALLASLCCGTVGSLVVVRKSTYIAGALAHCVLGGLGLARYLQVAHGWSWAHPMLGALLAACLASLMITWFSLKAKERLDTFLSAIWSSGMAIGVVFLMITPGYGEDLMGYLFGDILLVTTGDLIALALLDIGVLLVIAFQFQQLRACSFHPQLAHLRGIAVGLYEAWFLILVAVNVVLLIRVVGITLVIALLTLPAATAGRFTRTLPAMMLVATILCALFSVGGIVIAYPLDLPAGPVIILVATAGYLLSWVANKRTKRPM